MKVLFMKYDGRFGKYGGVYAPELLMPAIEELEEGFYKFMEDEKFQNKGQLFIRITSDPFRMPGNKTGYYGCSKLGLSLVLVNKAFDFEDAEKNNTFTSGDLIEVKIKKPDFQLAKDEKSGAFIIELD